MLSSISLGQTTWYEIPTGTSKKLNAINFPSNNVGYIVGEDSTILKTINGGQTWESLGMNGISISSLSDDFTDVHFVDENTGFLVAQYSGVYKTTDGAQSWTHIGTNMCFPETINPTSAADYIIGGGHCFEGVQMEKTVNNTPSQSTFPSGFADYEKVLEMSFANVNLGIAAVRNEYILRTVDAGNTWDTISTGITGELTSVVMVNDTLCFAGYDENGGGFGILKSVDAGLTWEQDINSATFYYPAYLSVHAAQNGDIYSGAVPTNSPGGLIFESTDITNWNYYTVDQPINSMTSYGPDITFGVGDSGYLVVNTPIIDLGIDKVDPIQFTVFPNPVLNILTIQNPNTETLAVQILDASGRILKKEMAQPGQNTINCSNLCNGMYFVKVQFGNRSGLQRIVKE